MSIEAKTNLLNTLEQKLSQILTVADMGKTLGTLADVLNCFDVQQITAQDHGSDDLLNAYLSAMHIQGRSLSTINRYTYIIKQLMDAVKVSTREITVYHIRKFLADEKARGISDRTLESVRQIYSAYFNWLQREGLLVQNPTANLGSIKCPKKAKTTYNPVDIEKLKLECANIRDRAIICFLLSTGCRISEMTQLDRNDIDFSTLECTVFGKGKKERTVYLDAVAGMTIKQYLDSRNDTSPALFAGKGSERLTPGGVRFMLRRLAQDAGVENVHPHKFRRTLATNLIHHGMPIQEVAAILGHDKLDTTMQYIVLDKTDIRNAYRKYA